MASGPGGRFPGCVSGYLQRAEHAALDGAGAVPAGDTKGVGHPRPRHYETIVGPWSNNGLALLFGVSAKACVI